MRSLELAREREPDLLLVDVLAVKVPDAGVRVRVQSQSGTSMRVRVDSTR